MALPTNPNTTPMPPNDTLVLSLLSEELKSRRFFNTLAEVGLDNPAYRPHLDNLILRCLGLTDDTNETFDFYCAAMNTHAGKIGVKEESVLQQAEVVYQKLVEYRGALNK